MITATARAAGRPNARPAPRPTRPSLRLVAPIPRAARRLPFVGAVVGLLVTGLLGLLLLNTLAAQDAFRLHDLRARAATLGDQEQALSVAVAQAQSPAALAARARALGMRPTADPAFLRLRDGRLIGAMTAVPPPPPPAPTTATTATTSTAAHSGAAGARTAPAAATAPATKPAAQPTAKSAAQPAAKPAPRPAATSLHAAPTRP